MVIGFYLKGIRAFLLLLFFSCTIHASLVESSLSGVFNQNSKAQRLLQEQDDKNHLFVLIEGLDSNSLGKAKQIQERLLDAKQISNVYFDIGNIKSESKIASIKNIETKEIREKLQLLKDEMQNSLLYTPIDMDDPLGILHKKSKSISHTNGFMTLQDRGYLIVATLDSRDDDAMELIKELDDMQDVVAFSPLEYFYFNQKKTKHDIATLLSIGVVILFLLYFVMLKNLKIILLHFLVQIPVFIISSLGVVVYFDSIHIFTIAFGVSFSSIGIDYLLHNYLGGYLKDKKLSSEVFFGFFSTFVGFALLFLTIDMLILKEIALYSLLSISLNYIIYSLLFQKLNLPIKKRALKLNSFYINPAYIFTIIGLLFVCDIYLFKIDLNPSFLSLKAADIDKKAEIFTENIQSRTLYYDANSFEKLYQKCRIYESKIDNFNSFCSNCIMDKDKLAIKLQNIKKTMIEQSKILGFKDDFFKESYIPNMPPICSKDSVIEHEGKYYAKADTVAMKTDGLYSPLSVARDELKEIRGSLLWSFALFFMTITILVLLFSKRKLVSLMFLTTPLLFAVFVVSIMQGSLNILHLFALILSLLILVDFSLYSGTKNGRESIFYAASTTLLGFGILVFSSIPTLNSIGIIMSSAMLAVLGLNSLKDKFEIIRKNSE
jgi:hypothetical protein